METLGPVDLQRHHNLRQKTDRLSKLAATAEDISTQKQTSEGAARLAWMHLKLLIARQHLLENAQTADPAELHRKADALRHELSTMPLTAEARDARTAVLSITEERLRNISLRHNRLDEINSSVDRIEAQVDLSLERAALHSGDARISIPLDLASRMVEDAEFFGASGPLVRELDKQHGTSLRMEKH